MFKTSLILGLSLLGLLMGFGTVWFIPYKSEIYFWIVIFLYSALRIGQIKRGNYFLHGFFVSMLNGFWYGVVHFFLFDKFIQYHPEEMMMLNQMSIAGNPRLAVLISGPVFGAIFGILLGGMAVVASQIIKKRRKKSS